MLLLRWQVWNSEALFVSAHAGIVHGRLYNAPREDGLFQSFHASRVLASRLGFD